MNLRSMLPAALLAAALLNPSYLHAQRGGGGQPPASPKASAPIELTGYWVSLVTEDWRYRMVTPAKGDLLSLPINAEGIKVANMWDPAADDAAGNQCKSYGAPALMRIPGRVHITWQDDNTLKVDTDAGTQTRLFHFGNAPKAAEATLQGESSAQWVTPNNLPLRGRGPAGPQSGSLRVSTDHLKAGYLRKNGAPYSENALLTEYYDVIKARNGDELLVITTVVEDPKYLLEPFIITSHFKKQANASGWDPTPCSSTW